MGKTFAEKVLSKAVGHDVKAGDIVTVTPDFCLSHENASGVLTSFEKIGAKNVFDPEKLVIVFDHTVPASLVAYADSHNVVRKFAKEQDLSHFYDLINRGGVCHQVMCQEGYAAPGLIIVGSDSHTCTAGAMGAFATGIGRAEMASVWATGEIWFKVPTSVRIELNGRFAPGVSAKDLILRIIGDFGADGADYMSVEFCGDGLDSLSLDERMTICNMGIEMGAKNVVCFPNDAIREIAEERAVSPRWEIIWADDDAEYVRTCKYDLSQIVPAVAKPHNVDNYAPVSEVEGVKIDQVFIGSCTNGRLSDLRAAASILKGKQVRIKTIVTPASCQVYLDALKEGLIQQFMEAGCVISHPGCGPCIGVAGGVVGSDEVCVSTSNRNFKGRMGSKTGMIYLASPMTAAYSALFGEIRDPRELLKQGGENK